MEISTRDFWDKHAQAKLQCMELRYSPSDKEERFPREVIFVLDQSNFIPEEIQDRILDKYKELYDEFFLEGAGLTPGLFVSYSRTVSGALFLPDAHEENKAHFKRREPTDRSALGQTLHSLADYMEKNTATKALTIILCIGGYENMETLGKLYNNLDYIYQVSQERLVDFHCVGVGDIHDAYLLKKLTRLATSKSTYHYAESPEDIDVALNNVRKMIKETPQGCFFVSKGQEKYKVVPYWDAPAQSFVGRLYGILPADASYNFSRFVDSRGVVSGGRLLWGQADDISPEQKVDFLRANITSFINNLNNKMSEEIIQRSREVLLKLDESVGELIKEVNEAKESIVQYRPVFFLAQKNRFLISKTIEAFELARKKNLSVHFIGALLAFACSLDTPQLYDFSRLVEIDQEILRVAREDAPAQDEPLPASIASSLIHQGDPMTISQWLARGDCLCVGLRIEGKEPADVYPKYISAETFLGMINSGNQALLTFKEGAEVINWVFPLYVSRGHWRVGKLKWDYLRELMELGEDFPFKLLMIAINKQAMLKDEGKEEFMLTRLYDLILDTCAQLWKDRGGIPEVVSQYENYAEHRNEINSNCLFCTKVLVGVKAGVLEMPTNEFVASVYQEEMRREVLANMKPLPSFQIDNILMTALGVITYWDNLTKALANPSRREEVYSHYLINNMLEDALDESHRNPILEEVSQLSLEDYKRLLSKYLREDLKNKEAKEWDKEACYYPIPEFLKHFSQRINQLIVDNPEDYPIISFKIDTGAPWYRALLVQNILRRNEPSAGLQLNDFFADHKREAPSASTLDYLYEKAKEILEDKFRKELDEVIYRQEGTFCAPEQFAKAPDLLRASAILYGHKMGADLKRFVEELSADPLPTELSLGKLALICRGKVRLATGEEISLWADFETFTRGSPVPGYWVPSKKILKRFSLAPEDIPSAFEKLNIVINKDKYVQ